MSILYVIGNGFDIAHGLRTSYWNFREFLEEHDWQFLENFEKLYGLPQIDENDPYTNVTAWRNHIYDYLWGSLEEKMSLVDTVDIVNVSDSITGQLDLDGGNWGIEDTMNEYWRDMFSFIEQLPQYVQQWITNIDLSCVSPKKKCLTDETDAMFLTFNYTATLEECYDIDPDSILHMHGALPPYSDYGPILGHGFKDGIDEHRQEADERYDEARKSVENAIADIYEATIKDTESIIHEHRYYFRKLDAIDQIVIIGLSYCDVDMPYLLEIKRSVSPSAHWMMYYHTEDDLNRLKKAIEMLAIETTLVEYKRSDTFWDA